MFRTIMIAAFAAATGNAAFAAPATPATSGAQSHAPSHVVQAQVVQVRKDKDWRRHSRDRRDWRRHYGYAPGAHLRHAPRGWHRYHARPYNWRTRNCVMVGPVWFCP
jgi:hypothetical protein